MRKVITLIITISFIFSSCHSVQAQDDSYMPKWKEFWKQNKTQIKYLGEFIGHALFKKWLEQQFQKESKKSLGSIHNEKNDNFIADNDYIKSLGEVPNFIIQSANLIYVISTNEFILNSYKESKRLLNNTENINSNQKDYLINQYKNLINQMNSDITELELIIVANSMKITDKERYDRLVKLGQEAKKKKVFTVNLNAGTSRLVNNAKVNSQENELLNTFND